MKKNKGVSVSVICVLLKIIGFYWIKIVAAEETGVSKIGLFTCAIELFLVLFSRLILLEPSLNHQWFYSHHI